ncbi:MAG: hypothetical protein AB7O52_19835 [Planctomycetota bacterium]
MNRLPHLRAAAVLIALIVGGDVKAQTSSNDLQIFSAFFGLDDSFPAFGAAAFGCPAAAGLDGMPLVMSRRLDPQTLDPSDFVVYTQSGVAYVPICVTLAPAIDPGENRTVLLLGEFGDDGVDPPVSVEITGELLTAPNECPGDFQGAQVTVTPLGDGPELEWAEVVPQLQWAADVPAGTVQVVRATWGGGVTQPSGAEIGDAERQLYTVTVATPGGSTVDVVPFALADLNDNDNNHELCLDVAGIALSVSFSGSVMTDPNGDLNLPSAVSVTIPRASCDPEFVRGDANGNGSVGLADALAILGYIIFGSNLPCLDAADASDSGDVSIGDAITILHSLHGGGSLPLTCEVDSTADALDCATSTCP